MVSGGTFSTEETTVDADPGEISVDGATVVSGREFSTETTVGASETSLDGATEVSAGEFSTEEMTVDVDA